MQYGPPPFLLNDNELLPFEHACMLREEHYSHPENLDSWESIMPTLWRFEVRWSIFGLLVHESQPSTRKKSDVQGFMIDSGPKLSPEHDRLSWTRFRFGQLSLIGANWTLISVFPNSLIF